MLVWGDECVWGAYPFPPREPLSLLLPWASGGGSWALSGPDSITRSSSESLAEPVSLRRGCEGPATAFCGCGVEGKGGSGLVERGMRMEGAWWPEEGVGCATSAMEVGVAAGVL